MNRVVLVTGMSGAGRTTALKALEDLGFEAVDNLPPSLLTSLLRPGDRIKRSIAIGIDCRTHAFSPDDLLALLDGGLDVPDTAVSMLFLDCDDDVLGRRFTETRRRHPLAPDRSVADGVRAERRLMAPLRSRADLVIDTSKLSPGELRRLIAGHFDASSNGRLVVSILSFSYREGLPREADLVFDVRFLKNPHYVPQLRPLTGVDSAIQTYLEEDPRFMTLLNDLERFVVPLLPAYQHEGKSYLTIAFGCTGGRHRSVATALRFAERVGAAGWRVLVHHRDTLEANIPSISPPKKPQLRPQPADDRWR